MDWRDRLGQSQSLQQFNREADEADSWLTEKLQMAMDESYKDPTNLPVSLTHSKSYSHVGYSVVMAFSTLQGKVKKHEAFVVEVAANKDRIFTIIQEGNGALL